MEEIVLKQEIVAMTKTGRFEITTAESYVQAIEIRKQVKGALKRVKDFFAPLKKTADEAKKALLTKEREYTEPLETMDAYYRDATARYDAEQEAKRRAEQARLEAVAREQAQAKTLADAKTAMRSGDTDRAIEILERPVEVASVTVQTATPRIEGVSYRTIWQFEILDIAAIPREYMIPDETKIGAVARASKGTIRIPGVRIFEKRIDSIRM